MSKKIYKKYIETISDLSDFGMRQCKNALLASKYIQKCLKKNNIIFKVQTYTTLLPVFKKALLIADGRRIPCLPTSFTSGEITDAYKITSSLISSKYFFDVPHINFNPVCKIISRPNFSNAPSLAIARSNVLRITKAKKIHGEVSVKRVEQKTEQILVGNIYNPTTIVFSHFDSIGVGTVDNASGTALCLELLLEQSELLEHTLFVFDGNEELSYDRPQYWGKGYRNFEQKFSKLIKQAKKLIIVDSIGYGPTETICNNPIILLAFPIKNIDLYKDKITILTSNYDKLMLFYHSNLDDINNIKYRFIMEARKILETLILLK